MDQVQILLSTYNAGAYIIEQLDSLLAQTYKNIEILIRDDGSSDETVEILARYAREHDCIKFYEGENLGSIGSFFDLMKHANQEASYYALCDQDDYWLPEKVEVAVETMKKEENQNQPLLYCSNTILVDAKLQPLEVSMKQIEKKPAFGNALVENICTGCTSVMNRRLLKEVVATIPEFTVMHDWWMYLVASGLGKAIYDTEGYIKYRQHGNNVMGSNATYSSEFKNRLKMFNKRKNNINRQAKEVVRLVKLNEEYRVMATWVAEYKKHFGYRMKLVFGKKVFRQRRLDNAIFRALFLLGLR